MEANSTSSQPRGAAPDITKLYLALIEYREKDAARLWTLFNQFAIGNGALFALVASRKMSSGFEIPVALIGCALCLAWTGMAERMEGWISDWEDRIELIEADALVAFGALTPTRPLLEVFRNRRGRVKVGFSTRVAAGWLPAFASVGWIVWFGILVLDPSPQ